MVPASTTRPTRKPLFYWVTQTVFISAICRRKKVREKKSCLLELQTFEIDESLLAISKDCFESFFKNKQLYKGW